MGCSLGDGRASFSLNLDTWSLFSLSLGGHVKPYAFNYCLFPFLVNCAAKGEETFGKLSLFLVSEAGIWFALIWMLSGS